MDILGIFFAMLTFSIVRKYNDERYKNRNWLLLVMDTGILTLLIYLVKRIFF